ncbi:MAG TPA: S46 family peptidase [Polyangiaceae bacterium]|nr:S46 family peptidase [Polyangiaceae bacterium]
MRLHHLARLLVLATACSAERPPVPLGPPLPPLPPEGEPAPPPAAARAPVVHESTGGLFMPQQVPSVLDDLKKLGLKVDPAQLSDPLSPLLASIVNLGGCSASFVSAGGLIATNHHCAVLALQYNSTPESNLLRDGFLAPSEKEERSAGPTARVYVTRALKDVSERARSALTAEKDDLLRKRALEKFEKTSIAACEKPKEGIRCELKSFYGGLRYYLIEKLELRDVRIVYAPPSGIGNYGGEIDNWRWPRHTGDFALFRAYTGAGGVPSDYAAANVPYRPPHHLELTKKELAEGDLAIVAGYPGRTSALSVAKEVEETVGWTYPRRLEMFEAYLAAVEAVGATDPDAKLKGTAWTRRFSNFRTKHQGELEGFAKGNLLERKRADEQALRAYIAADPERQKRAGGALEAIDQAIEKRNEKREPDTALSAEILMPRLVSAATLIVRMAEERQKPDADRDPDYQERRVPDLRDELDALDARYHPKLDAAILTLALTRALHTPAADRTPALALIAGPKPTEASIHAAVEKLYAGTTLADAKIRRALFEKATPAELKKSKDSMIRLAVTLRPLIKEVEERQDRFAGKLLLEEPRYEAALLEQKGGRVPPDANGTLRLSYGVVRRPAGGGSAFTWLSEVVKKNQNKEPFAAPKALLDAAAQKQLGPYRDSVTRDVPVDFLTDLQITNGNSGSATLDAEGRLIGLAFDGTYDSVASDWVFLPTTCSIHVDVRYLLWVLTYVSKADWVLAELGVKPRAR